VVKVSFSFLVAVDDDRCPLQLSKRKNTNGARTKRKKTPLLQQERLRKRAASRLPFSRTTNNLSFPSLWWLFWPLLSFSRPRAPWSTVVSATSLIERPLAHPFFIGKKIGRTNLAIFEKAPSKRKSVVCIRQDLAKPFKITKKGSSAFPEYVFVEKADFTLWRILNTVNTFTITRPCRQRMKHLQTSKDTICDYEKEL
jgi:hypothetical protein